MGYTSIEEKDRGRWRRAMSDQVGMDTSAGWQLRRREKQAVGDRSDAYTHIYMYILYICTYDACKYICTYIICTHIKFALRVFKHVRIYYASISPNIRVYAGMYKYARIRMKTYGSHTRAWTVVRPGGDWLAVDSALPNMGQSRRSIHKTTGRAAAQLSPCATPTHHASF